MNDSASILGGVRLPPDTEIIKYTSSIVGPKIPGNTNRGRKKTISLDPPSVSVTPTHSSTGLLIDRYKRPLPPLDSVRPYDNPNAAANDRDRLEVRKLPAHSNSSNGGLNLPPGPGGGPRFPPAPASEGDEAPLDLCTKPAGKRDEEDLQGVQDLTSLKSNKAAAAAAVLQAQISSLSALSALGAPPPAHGDRSSRRKPGPKPKRVPPAAHSPILSPSTTPGAIPPMLGVPGSPSASLAQLFAAADTRPEDNDATHHKDGRPRNLGRGVSKPKKNTVASLLAQSRALGIKPSPNMDLEAQFSFLRNSMAAVEKQNEFKERDTDGEHSNSHDGSQDHHEEENLNHKPESESADETPTPAHEDKSEAHAPEDPGQNKAPKPEQIEKSGGTQEQEQEEVAKETVEDTSHVNDIASQPEDASKPSDIPTEPKNTVDGTQSGSENEFSSESDDDLDDGSGEPNAKRRKLAPVDERLLRLPLERGWRRETLICGLSRSGLTIKGEVTYITPCNRRFKQYPELLKHLAALAVAADQTATVHQPSLPPLTRENFTFSSKVIIGDFLQPTANDQTVRLSDTDVAKRLEELVAMRGLTGSQHSAQMRELKLQQMKQDKEAKVKAREEAAKQKEQLRIQKEQERCEKAEALKREREQRNQQLLELYMQEMNKQRELLYTVELERERRRQHMALVRSLENRKRLEERERKRLEARAEKLANREKKLEQRRIDVELLTEIRKPVEDMELGEEKCLPVLERVPGLQLCGQAFLDTLMVFEFLHTFGETLGFDMESLPTLNNLQAALLNDQDTEEELLSVMTHLLVCAIEDPGIPNPARHITILGQSLKQADITHSNISEIMRIYLYANATGEVKALSGLNFERDREKRMSDHHNSYDDTCPTSGKNAAFFACLRENPTWAMSEWLRTHPFLALSPSCKAAILAFLCNELLQNKAVTGQIEKAIENGGQIRKDRYILDNKLRKLRLLHQRKARIAALQTLQNAQAGTPLSGQLMNSPHTAHTVAVQTSTQQPVAKSDAQTTPNSEPSSETQTETSEIAPATSSDGTPPSASTTSSACTAVAGATPPAGAAGATPPAGSSSPAGTTPPASSVCLTNTTPSAEISVKTDEAVGPIKPVSDTAKSESAATPATPAAGPPKKQVAPVEAEEAEDDNEDDSCNESEGTLPEGTLPEEEEDLRLSAEELAKKIDRVQRQLELNLQTLNASTYQLRATPLGQDRYYRRYWALPTAGGVFVEAMESAEPDLYHELKNQPDLCKKRPRNDDEVSEDSEEGGPRPAKERKEDSEEHSADEEVNGTDGDDEDNEDNDEEDEDDEEVKSITKIEESNGSLKAEASGCAIDEPKEECKEPTLEAADHKSIKQENRDAVEEKMEVDSCDVVPIKKEENEESLVDDDSKVNVGIKNDVEDVKPVVKVEDGAGTDKPADDDSTPTAVKVDITSGLEGGEQGSAHKTEEADDKAKEDDIKPAVNHVDASSQVTSTCPNAVPSVLNNVKDLNGGCSASSPPRPASPEKTWFSIIPRDSCDNTSVGNNPARIVDGELRVPVYGCGRLPSPVSMLPLCESPPPLMMTSEEAEELERVKLHGPPEPLPCQPIPKNMLRGWWKISKPEYLTEVTDSLHQRGIREGELKRNLVRHLEASVEASVSTCPAPEDKSLVELHPTDIDVPMELGAPSAEVPLNWSDDVALRVDLAILEQVEAMEDRVANASMQVKGWKVPNRATSEEGFVFRPSCLDGHVEEGDERANPVTIAKDRLLCLEAAIERRYLKPPLGISVGDVNLMGLSGDQSVPDPESLPKGLVIWRDAVSRSHTAAQLAMSLYMLESSIAWDKSIMKANCQFCHSGDNEDKLLLCDGCDRGYHTYCFKPKMENIPDGDWYCYECLNKATGDKNCIVCGKKTGRNLLFCDNCPRVYHTDCLTPPLNKVPRGKWYCQNCHSKVPKSKRTSNKKSTPSKSRSDKDKNENTRDSESSDQPPSSPPYLKPPTPMDSHNDPPEMDFMADSCSMKQIEDINCTESPTKHPNSPPQLSPYACPSSSTASSVVIPKKTSKRLAKELTPCRMLLDELEEQEESWPFLLPVNTKQFPTYRKIIRWPMDLSSIKKKLIDGQYKSREDFCSDVRLIFNNCEIFNEDDSPVGKAGHCMRTYFETRWGEINGHAHKGSPHSNLSPSR